MSDVGSGVQIGEAFVRIRPDASGFEQGVQQTGRTAGQLMADAFIATFTVVGAKKLIDAASSLEQAVGGTKAVFGEASAAVEEFAQNSADAAGLSERAARELTAQIGGLLKGFGFTKNEAADLSVQLTQLGADLAATFGGAPEEAVQALAAALRGEFDPLERFGISLNVTQANLKAVELGLATSTSEVDQHAKAQGALALIMERSADAQGQFAREANTASGQMERAKAQLEDAAASIGSNFLPAVATGSRFVGELAAGFGALPGPVQTAAIAMGGLSVIANRLGVKDLDTLKSALQGVNLAAVGAGVGIAASLYAYSELTKRQEEARKAGEALRKQLSEEVKTDSYEDLRKRYDRIVGGIQELDTTISNSKAPWDADYRKELQEYRNQLAGAADDTAAMINVVDGLATSQGIGANEALRFVQQSAAFGNTFKTSEDAVTAYMLAQSGLDFTVGATTNQLQKQGTQAEVTKKQLDHLKDSTLGLYDAQLSAEEGAILTEKAIKELGQIYAFGAIKGDELRLKEIEVTQMILDQAQAAVDAAAQQAALFGAQLSAADAATIQRDKLQEVANTLAPGSPLRAQLQTYIDDLNTRIPKEVSTKVNLNIAADTAAGQGTLNTAGANAVLHELFRQADQGGPRAAGGPVSPGRSYPIVERGAPEVFTDAEGNSYLLPAGQGRVTPVQPGGGSSFQQHVTINVASNVDDRSVQRVITGLRKQALLLGAS